jgi:hypothetical protein
MGERCLEPLSIASRILRISAASWPKFSLNLPTFLLVSARFLLALPAPLTIRIPRTLRPDFRLAPKATPPASPARAAPPASAGPFTFPAFPAADEIACPLLCAPLVTASLPFEATCLTACPGAPELPEDRLRELPLARGRPLPDPLDLRLFELLLPLRDERFRVDPDPREDADDRIEPLDRRRVPLLPEDLFCVLVFFCVLVLAIPGLLRILCELSPTAPEDRVSVSTPTLVGLLSHLLGVCPVMVPDPLQLNHEFANPGAKCDNISGQAVSLRRHNGEPATKGKRFRGTLRRAGEP